MQAGSAAAASAHLPTARACSPDHVVDEADGLGGAGAERARADRVDAHVVPAGGRRGAGRGRQAGGLSRLAHPVWAAWEAGAQLRGTAEPATLSPPPGLQQPGTALTCGPPRTPARACRSPGPPWRWTCRRRSLGQVESSEGWQAEGKHGACECGGVARAGWRRPAVSAGGQPSCPCGPLPSSSAATDFLGIRAPSRRRPRAVQCGDAWPPASEARQARTRDHAVRGHVGQRDGGAAGVHQRAKALRGGGGER